jgi:quercetin 2,3-dioxygenase
MEEKPGKLRVLASPDGRERSIKINQDALIYSAALADDDRVVYPLADGRTAYVRVAKGCVRVNGTLLHVGEGVKIRDGTDVTLEAVDDAEALIFDLS